MLPFTEALVIVGDVLRNKGIVPVFVQADACRCGLSGGLSNTHRASSTNCTKCAAQNLTLRTTLKGWKFCFLKQFARPEDFSDAESQMEKVRLGDFRAFAFRGVEVGRAAIHDTALKFKIDSLDFQTNPELWREYQDVARSAILAVIRLDRLCEHFKPIGLITYNSNYSLNRVASLACRQRKIPTFSIHGGPSLKKVWDTLKLTNGDIEAYRLACVQNWSDSMSKRALSPHDVQDVGQHFHELFSGRKAHAYSAAAGSAKPADVLRALVRRDSGRKTLLLCLSSSDERFSVEQSGIRPCFPASQYAFPAQQDLVNFVVAKVAERTDIDLVIRVHPRDFPNKREPRTSANGQRLKKALENLPGNVHVNWPDQSVSFYELLQHVDLVLTAWSTVALEASLFGCPIVLPYNPTHYYDVCADSVSRNPDEYWDRVSEYMCRPWTLQRCITTFRWYWMMQLGGTVSLVSERKRCCSLAEWGLRAFDWGSKAIFRGSPPYAVPSDGFRGHFKRLVYRRLDPEGRKAIEQTLLGEFEPMKNFRELQNIQGKSGHFTNSERVFEKERLAVYGQLAKFAQLLNVTEEACSHSKFLAMLHSEKAADNVSAGINV